MEIEIIDASDDKFAMKVAGTALSLRFYREDGKWVASADVIGANGHGGQYGTTRRDALRALARAWNGPALPWTDIEHAISDQIGK